MTPLRGTLLLMVSASLMGLSSCKKDKKDSVASMTKPAKISSYNAYLDETVNYVLIYNEDGTLKSLASSDLDIVNYTYHGSSIVAHSTRGGFATEYDSTIIDANGRPVRSMHRDVFGTEYRADFTYDAEGRLQGVISIDGSDYPYTYHWDGDDLSGIDQYPGGLSPIVYDKGKLSQPGDMNWIHRLLEDELTSAPAVPRIGNLNMPSKHLCTGIGDYKFYTYSWNSHGQIVSVHALEDGPDVTWTLSY